MEHAEMVDMLAEMRMNEMMDVIRDALSAKLEEQGTIDRAHTLNPIEPTYQAIAAVIVSLLR